MTLHFWNTADACRHQLLHLRHDTRVSGKTCGRQLQHSRQRLHDTVTTVGDNSSTVWRKECYAACWKLHACARGICITTPHSCQRHRQHLQIGDHHTGKWGVNTRVIPVNYQSMEFPKYISCVEFNQGHGWIAITTTSCLFYLEHSHSVQFLKQQLYFAAHEVLNSIAS